MLSPPDSVSGKSRNSRRNTLTVMVEPFIKKARGSKGTPSSAALETPLKEKITPVEKDRRITASPAEDTVDLPATKEVVPPSTPGFSNRQDISRGFNVPASTVKASKVMNWFRSKSKGKPLVDEPEKIQPPSESEASQQLLSPNAVSASSSSSVNNTAGQPSLALPTSVRPPVAAMGHPPRSSSAHTETSFSASNFADLMWRRHPPPTKGALRVHHGAVDATTLTTGSPPEVMKHVTTVLQGMGLEVHIESDFKYRCVRPKRRKATASIGLGLKDTTGSGLAAFTMVGSAASNGVDKRGLPQPPQSAFGTGGMLRGLLMRRQSSQVSTSTPQPIEHDVNPEAALAAVVPNDGSSPANEPIYGDTQQDRGDEVRFSVELTRIDRLDDTYSLDIRRLKGNLSSYKFLYDTVRVRADLRK